MALHALSANAETEREPDITVTAERAGKWEMSFEDMEFVNRSISCGKRLYSDGQKRAAWPYLKMGARYGDIDSQFIASNMLFAGEDVPRDWNAAVGWLGVAAAGNIKPLAQKRLRESKRRCAVGARTASGRSTISSPTTAADTGAMRAAWRVASSSARRACRSASVAAPDG